MDYNFTVPVNTQQAAPAIVSIPIMDDVVTAWSVFFPPGCEYLVGIEIFVNGQQVAPSLGTSMWLTGDGQAVGGSCHVEVNYPYVMIKGYNLASDYSHTPHIQLTTERKIK